MFDPRRSTPAIIPAYQSADKPKSGQIIGDTPGASNIPSPRSATDSTLDGIAGLSPETTRALQSANATLFFTPGGQRLIDEMEDFFKLPLVETAKAYRRLIMKAGAATRKENGGAVLLLGYGHNMASTLTAFHAATDLCATGKMHLFLEDHPAVHEALDLIHQILAKEPKLKKLLGKTSLESREGQAIAWEFVRASDNRGALQRMLPEALALMEIKARGIPFTHVDPLSVEGASDPEREAKMCQLITQKLKGGDKGVFLGGLAHVSPMNAALSQLGGIKARSLVVFDATADAAESLYDLSVPRSLVSYRTATEFRQNLEMPNMGTTAATTQVVRMPFEVYPFCS